MAILKTQPLDQVFHALGDPTRRAMLTMLTKSQKLSANEMATPFRIAQPTVSKHLKVLEQSALITRTVEGRTHYFQLRPETLASAEDWLHRHRQFWTGNFARLGQLVQSLTEDKGC